MDARSATSKTEDRAELIVRGRAAFRNRQWGLAFSDLSAADAAATLDPQEVAELAQAALLTGREAQGIDLLARAHSGFAEQGAEREAARCAFWLGFMFMVNGETAQSGGWLARASRLLEAYPDCGERGYLLLPVGYSSFYGGELEKAESSFRQAAVIGKRHGEHDLITLGLQGQGRALIRQGKIVEGVGLLDEAMIAVMTGECSALNAGGVYCSVLDACSEIFDLRRAQEWSSALDRWCSSQPDLVPYRGHCRVHRAELLQLHGSWEDAFREAKEACAWLAQPSPKPALGGALYQLAELHRVRGEFAEAEDRYAAASQWQRAQGPGLALLRLAQGQPEASYALIRQQLDHPFVPGRRARLLGAYVEIALAAGDLEGARAACDELASIQASHQIPYLEALARQSRGAVHLADGNLEEALAELRQAVDLWSELQAPYETARVRVQIALAYRRLNDEARAKLELDAACDVFQRLGAAVDCANTEAMLQYRPTGSELLTERELQVLRLVASGKTNRQIAAQLHISEKTVARHVSNIFNKLDLNSRTAAAAYAYDSGLV